MAADSILASRATGKLADVRAGVGRGIGSVSAILESMTTVEIYISDMVGILFRSAVERKEPIYRILVEQAINDADSSWGAGLEALATYFGARVTKGQELKRFADVAFLRNALAHGGDRFTRRQAKSVEAIRSAAGNLRVHLDVQVFGCRICLTESTPFRVVEICETAVAVLDRDLCGLRPELLLAQR